MTKIKRFSIKIDGKSIEIKTASNFTVAEYIEANKLFVSDKGALDMLMTLISVGSNTDREKLQNVEIEAHNLNRISHFVGNLIQPKQIVPIDQFYHKVTGKTIYANKVTGITFGIRSAVEKFKADTSFEQMVYLLAILIKGTSNVSQIKEVYDELQTYNYIDVFGFVYFFFKK